MVLALTQNPFSFTLSSGPEGYQCLQSAGRLPTFPGVRFSEGLAVRPDGTVFVARGPDGVSAFTPTGRIRSRVTLDARELSLVGDRLWVRGDGIGVAVIDVSNPDALRLISTWEDHPFLPWGAPRAIHAEASRLWVAWGHQLEVFDVTGERVLLTRHPLELDAVWLRRSGNLLLIQHWDSFSVWNVEDVTRPTQLTTAKGQLFFDADTAWRFDEGRLSRLTLHEDAAPESTLIGTLDARAALVAIADGKVFVRHDAKSLAVLALPSLAFIDAFSGDFETGGGPTAELNHTIFVSSRFGGLQRIPLESIKTRTPESRFAGIALERNHFHGDLITVNVLPGESVSTYLKRFRLEEPSPNWEARLEPLRRVNVGSFPDFPLIRPGDRIAVPLPRALVCRP
ncbi:MAG: hypothetical protein QM817_01290 [Archangium sp.]